MVKVGVADNLKFRASNLREKASVFVNLLLRRIMFGLSFEAEHTLTQSG